MKKENIFSILLIVLFGLFYLFWFDFKNNLVLIGWDTMFPLNPSANLKYLTTWVDNNNGTVILSSLHFMILLYWLFSKLALPITVMQFLHVYIIHVVGAIGTYYLAYKLFETHPQKKYISLMSGIIYLFSPAFLNMYFAYPPIGFISLALALFIDGLQRKNKYLFALAIAFIVSLGNLPDPHPRPFLLILAPIILYSCIEASLNKNIKRIFSYLLLILIYIFLFNAWYFLGFIANSFFNSNLLSSAKSIPLLYDNRFRDEGTALIGKMFRLFHDGLVIPGDKSKSYLSNIIIIIANYLQPVLAFSSLIFLKKQKKENRQSLLFLLILSLIFLYLAKSVNPPFGAIYRLALENIPLLRMFRTSAYFIIEVAISYSILIPFTIVEMGNYFNRYKILPKIIGFALFVLILLNSYPIILGYPSYFQPDPAQPATHGMKLPNDYYRLNEFLQSRTEDAKILTLPVDPGYELLDKNPWYFGIPMLPFILEKPLINQRYQDFGSSFSLPLMIEKELIEGNSSALFLTSMSNIRYIVMKNNARYAEVVKSKKNLAINFKLLKSIDNLDIYENPVYLSHVYVPDTILISEKSLEMLPDIIVKNDLRGKNSIYFSVQNTQAKLSELKKIKNETYKSPVIEHKKISQTKYRVSVKKAHADFPLIFNESFHNGWKLYLGNKRLPDNLHLVANSFANSWIIEPFVLCDKSKNCLKNPDGSYNFEVIIEYFPQKLFHIGYLIAALTVIITVSYYLYGRFTKK